MTVFELHDYEQLADAAFSVRAQAVDVFDEVVTGHVVLFVLSWLLCLAFVLCMFRPFIQRVGSEMRQIAKMLSQLPPELDVEGLVAEAMGRLKARQTGGLGLGLARAKAGNG